MNKMELEQLVEKLKILGVFPKTVDESAEIFRSCTNIEAIAEEVGRRHYTCGEEQFVYFHLGALLRDSEFKAKFLTDARKELDNQGIRPEHIDEYFQSGADPGLVFMSTHEEYGPSEIKYPREVMLTFSKRADQFALDKMREWLGVKEKT